MSSHAHWLIGHQVSHPQNSSPCCISSSPYSLQQHYCPLYGHRPWWGVWDWAKQWTPTSQEGVRFTPTTCPIHPISFLSFPFSYHLLLPCHAYNSNLLECCICSYHCSFVQPLCYVWLTCSINLASLTNVLVSFFLFHFSLLHVHFNFCLCFKTRPTCMEGVVSSSLPLR